MNDCAEFGEVDGDSENGDGVDDSVRGAGSVGSKKVPEGDCTVDVFVKNEEIVEELKYGDEDRMENVMEVVGMKKDVEDGVEDVEDGITVNGSVPRDCRMLLLAERVV